MAQVTVSATKTRSRLAHTLLGVALTLVLLLSCLLSWNQLTKLDYGVQITKVTHNHGVTNTVFYDCKGFGSYLKCPKIDKGK